MAEGEGASGGSGGQAGRVPLLLACLLLAAPLSGESSTGKTRATATTTVSVSIPALLGIRLPQQDTRTGEPGGVVFASLSDAQARGLKIRLTILTTIGDGSVVLSRSLPEESPAVEPALLPAARRKSREDGSGFPAFFSFPSGAFGWRSLEERLGSVRTERVSHLESARVARVVYELWQF